MTRGAVLAGLLFLLSGCASTSLLPVPVAQVWRGELHDLLTERVIYVARFTEIPPYVTLTWCSEDRGLRHVALGCEPHQRIFRFVDANARTRTATYQEVR